MKDRRNDSQLGAQKKKKKNGKSAFSTRDSKFGISCIPFGIYLDIKVYTTESTT